MFFFFFHTLPLSSRVVHLSVGRFGVCVGQAAAQAARLAAEERARLAEEEDAELLAGEFFAGTSPARCPT